MVSAGASGTVTVENQRSYIKIETLCGINPTEIHTALHEVCGEQTGCSTVCGEQTLDCSTVASRQRTVVQFVASRQRTVVQFVASRHWTVVQFVESR